MLMKSLAAGVSALSIVFAAGAVAAQGASTTVELPDGTTIVTTVTGPTSLTIEISGGPNPPVSIDITNLVYSGDEVTYTGTATVSGTTTDISCVVDLGAGVVTGSDFCDQAFASSSTGGGGGGTGGGGTVTTTGLGTITGGATIIETPGPGGTTIYTMELPNGTIINVTPGETLLFRNVQAEQFLLGLAADIRNINDVQSLIAQRFGQMQAAGIAPQGISLTANDAYRGRNAGPGGMAPFFWVDGQVSRIENDLIGSGVDGHSRAFTVGGDLNSETVTIGAFASYGDTDLDGVDAISEEDGFTAGAYVRWSFTPGWVLTGAVGGSDMSVYYSRTVGGLTSTGNTDRSSTFALLGVETRTNLSPSVVAVPSLTIVHSESDSDAYTDSNGFVVGGVSTETTIGSLGGAFYFTGGNVTPFVALNYNHDLDAAPGQDDGYGTVGLGAIARVGANAALIGSLNAMVGKSGETDTGVSLTLRSGF